jgi:hypothetical protein
VDARLQLVQRVCSPWRLKALIKSIRATKTIADERVLITKESAAIRSAFKARWGRVCVCRGI